MGQIAIFAGAAPRRRWSDAEKAELVARAFAPGAVAAHVAGAAGLRTNLLYRWRKQLGEKAAGGFARLEIEPEARGLNREAAVRVRLSSADVEIADYAPAALAVAVVKALAR